MLMQDLITVTYGLWPVPFALLVMFCFRGRVQNPLLVTIISVLAIYGVENVIWLVGSGWRAALNEALAANSWLAFIIYILRLLFAFFAVLTTCFLNRRVS